MKPSRRYHPYGCKRDKENVGYLGRMSNSAYNELCKKHSVISHTAVSAEKDKVGRMTQEEYDKMQAEARMVKTVLEYVRRNNGEH